MEIDFEKLLLLSDEFYKSKFENEDFITKMVYKDEFSKERGLYNKFRQAIIYSDIDMNNLLLSQKELYELLPQIYTGDIVSSHLNKNLDKTPEIEQHKYIKYFEYCLNISLSNFPSYDNQVVWHNVVNHDYIRELPNIDNILLFKQFISTSKVQWENRNCPMYYNIQTLPKNSKAKDIEHISLRQGNQEDEVLFMSNTTFKVIDVVENIVYMEELS
jgi:hypothetical protein